MTSVNPGPIPPSGGTAAEATQPSAAARHTLLEDWHAAGIAAERAHQDYLAQWAAEKVPAACTVVFQAEDSKNGPQWSDQRVTFLGSRSGAEDVPLASYDSRNDPELVKSLDALTELTPPAHEDDELHIVVTRARA
ncbi:hypothetical protein ACIP93_31825 [Streptomyces sp. NPDC088745]|uniref:hypothetical protein n=1 Tax=Streptomyces sp. NPDC088745 TaxID=3365884 RepID=UPI00382849F8